MWLMETFSSGLLETDRIAIISKEKHPKTDWLEGRGRKDHQSSMVMSGKWKCEEINRTRESSKYSKIKGGTMFLR